MPDDFRNSSQKTVTLFGMSGLGKTTLSEILQKDGWFHYSVDYRIGTAYLDEPILEDLYERVRHIKQIRELLDSRTIKIQNDITIDNLKPLSSFIGKLGNPESDGLPLKEFRRRQTLYNKAEIAAMNDVPDFIAAARKEGCAHFVCDSSGSLCEIEDETVFEMLAAHSLLVYIEATPKDEEELLRRAQDYPKPLYFPPAFFREILEAYEREHGFGYVALIEPDEFARWVFPRLFRSRLPKYKRIANMYGCTISADDVRSIKTASDFIDVVDAALARKKKGAK